MNSKTVKQKYTVGTLSDHNGNKQTMQSDKYETL